jgi:diguanylate cyclase (GGDEF)-like protein
MNLPEEQPSAGWLSRREMARALGLLYVVGGVLALVWLMLPHEPDGGDRLATLMAVVALVFGTVVAVAGPASTNASHLGIVVIQLVIAVAYVGEGAPAGDARFFFIWATPYAAFYFGRQAAAAHIVWTGIVLAVSLALMPTETHRFAPGVYLITMGTVVATAVLVSWPAHKLRAAEAAQRELACTDTLTGLPNRVLFASRAAEAICKHQDEGGTLAVMVLDLDRFKLINDTYGHSFGDELLKVVAPRLRSSTRASDLVVRLGGDEFGVLVHDSAVELDVGAIAERLTSAWSEPFWVNGIVVHTHASTGIAVARSPEDTAESLLRDADAAMYATKGSNPGGWSWFSDRMREGMLERLGLEHQLSEAISRRELHLAYQPIVELATGRTSQIEALLRWTPAGGPVAPAAFIALAEETGLIFSLGTWVLENALAQLARWRADGVVPDDFVMTVNVSARQLRQGFAQEVAEILHAEAVPGTALGLEVTETALITDPTMAESVIAELRALQIGFLLDDFGTGYSSLTHLQRFPLDAVKLDRSFVTDVGPRRVSIVEAVVCIGDALGLAVIAEGVETQAQAEALLELGCVSGQGYFFAGPMSAEQLEAHLSVAARPVNAPDG